MERRPPSTVATFFAADLTTSVTSVVLAEAAARHVAVRRLNAGSTVRLVNGHGVVAIGRLINATRQRAVIEIEHSESTAPPPSLELLAPVADRDRMLWLAEKCAELSITVWQPVMFARSRSVAPRGEGDVFREKTRARMVAALEQSGAAWLPDIRMERPLAEAVASVQSRARYLLDVGGESFRPVVDTSPSAIVVGPEGGLEADERALLSETGWQPISLGSTTLRFETAAIVAVGIIRASAVGTGAIG